VTSTLFRYRVRLRRNWRSWLLLAFLSAIALGFGVGAAADARRADSALRRALESGRAADVIVDADETALGHDDARELLEAARELPGVEAAADLGAVNFALVEPDGSLTDLTAGSALGKIYDPDELETVSRFRFYDGRAPRPEHAEEVLANPEFLEMTDSRVGDQITSLRLFRIEDFNESLEPDPAKGTDMVFTIVGSVRRPEELLSEGSERLPQLYLTPAFGEKYPKATYYRNLQVRLTDGAAGIPAFADAFTALASGDERNQLTFVRRVDEGYEAIQGSVEPQVTAVWLFAAVMFIAGLLLAGQAIARQQFAHNRDLPDLRALGMNPRELRRLVFFHGATVAAATTVLCAILAALSSIVTPVGSTHAYEPDTGLRLEGATLTIGALLTLIPLAIVAYANAHRLTATARRGEAAAIRAERPSRVVLTLARAGLPPTVVTGSRFALQPGSGRTATPVRSVLTSIALAVAVLVIAMSFSSYVDRLVHDKHEYGWDWDIGISNAFGSIPDEFVDALREFPDVVAVSGYTQGQLQISGDEVAAVGIDLLDGTVFPTLTEGRLPQSDDEIVLGRLTLRDLDASVGDEIEVEAPGGPRTMTIVGVATFPAIGARNFTTTSLGRGAATVASVLPAPKDDFAGTYSGLFIRVDESDRTASISEIQEFAADVDCKEGCFVTDARPQQLDGYAKLGDLWVPFAAALGLLLTVSLAHGIASTARARRHDMAILSALGLKRGQTSRIVVWQAVTMVVIALAVAVPFGIVVANVGWRIFTDHFGIRPPIDLPVSQLVLLALVALIGAIGVALLFVPRVRRLPQISRLAAE
jgi:ABC-type lipoprotein release transport system permease subunit